MYAKTEGRGAATMARGEWREKKKHLINAFIFNIFINNPAFHFAPPVPGKHSQRRRLPTREMRENGSTKDL